MPDFTITVTAATAQRVQAMTAAYNEAHGTSLTGVQWVKRQLAEVIFADDFNTAETNLRAAANRQLLADATAAREALIVGA